MLYGLISITFETFMICIHSLSNWIPTGKRKKRRQKCTWLDEVKYDLLKIGIGDNEVKKKIKDRKV